MRERGGGEDEEDEIVPKGWKDGKPATPASSKRRKWGKLTKKEIISNKKSCHNIQGMFLKKMEHLPSVSVTLGEGQNSILLGPDGDGQTSSLLGATASKNSTFVQPLGSPGETLSTRRGFTNITNRGMGKAASPCLSPGGRPVFKEEDINCIGSMIKQWEEMEKEGEGEIEEGRGRSEGRRVSELAMSYERKGGLSTEGRGGGNHINQTGGGISDFVRGHSASAYNLSQKHCKNLKNVKPSEEIMKINANSKTNFKTKKVCSQSGNTQSGDDRDWPATPTNRRQGLRSKHTNHGW